jgi:hypothetical protein
VTDYKYKCQFCGKHFVHEGWYLKHQCEQMKRDQDMRTPQGQAAWRFYQLWLTKNRKKARNVDTFMTSRFYNAFIKFTEFVHRTGLPEPDTFIGFMVRKNYDPFMWTDSRIYRAYLEYLDRQGDPWNRIETTIKTIKRYTNSVDCKPSEIFDFISSSELVHKIYSRELSPWFLLTSQRFMNYYRTKLNHDEKLRVDTVIRPKFWRERFDKNPNIVKDVQNIVKRLNL